MKIVILCSKYPLDSENSYLTSDLGTALAKMGHSVSVVCLDWDSKSPEGHYQLAHDVEVYNFVFELNTFLDKISPVRRFFKWMFFSTIVRFKLPQKLRDEKIDLLIDFSPATTTRAVFSYLKKLHQCKSFLVLWDFFPYYQLEMGIIPKPLFKFLKAIEQRVINSHEYVGCMSDENINYLNRHYKLNKNVKALVVPLWGPKECPDLVPAHETSKSETSCVFGGQLIAGRGLDLIIDLAKRCQRDEKRIVFSIAGDGPLKNWLTNTIVQNDLKNVRYLGQLTRDEYFQLLGTSSIGLVFNSGHYTVPTYPSKTIDYFRCKLPILGAVEAATDYKDIIQNTVKAGFCSVADDIDEIYKNLITLSSDPGLRQRLGQNGYNYFQKHMTSETIAETIIQKSNEIRSDREFSI